ncbi:hypothetical protein Sango_2509600 [Sesamum angolense]|uniref:Endonuclease/exonuclease/phosphatase domain-containing protein n=1 Tax=Sesamum angolense TaxID=2727404 RepID=A0AAE2BIA7_9LAMI|nr:hypothetical protein Sango_2509600 [Sesamum angolense]
MTGIETLERFKGVPETKQELGAFDNGSQHQGGLVLIAGDDKGLAQSGPPKKLPSKGRGSARRGHRSGRGVRGHPRKRSSGISGRLLSSPAGSHETLSLELSGAGPPWTVHTLKEHIQLHRPSLVFRSETNYKSRRCDRVKNLVNYNRVGVDSVGKGGGLLLLWCKDLDVWLQSFLSHHIDMTVKSEDYPERWRFTGFYGYPEVGNRKEGWTQLRKLTQQSVRPWICAGDFNEISYQQEKQGGLPWAHRQMRDFRECLDDCGLQDIGFEGKIFRWWNRREVPHTVCARLDRACNNLKWAEIFPQAIMSHEAVTCSDHSLISVGLEGKRIQDNKQKKHRFRFEAVWLSAPECADNDVSTEAKKEIEKLKDAIKDMAGKEEILWNQRAKALWLATRDRNTGFFHAKANERKVRKEIKLIKDATGNEVGNKKGIQRVVLSYFRSIFTSTNPIDEAVNEVLEYLDCRVTLAMNEALLLSFTSEEITRALKEMHPLKSLGPDSMSPIFYQKFWPIVCNGVCESVLEFLNKGSLDPLLNFTHIVLIPICPKPTDMSHFRPISLCNVLCKLASKAIANRMKHFLDALISTSQAAFSWLSYD